MKRTNKKTGRKDNKNALRFLFYYKPKQLSYILSTVIHILLMLFLFLINIDADFSDDEYVTVGFGTFGNVSTAGRKGDNIPNKPREKIPEENKNTVEEQKIVELPKAEVPDENVIPKLDNETNEGVTFTEEEIKPVNPTQSDESKGNELTGEGEGNFGFEIDFGGQGIRKIYSYSLPEYPEGVSKEIDVKLRFTILPDGTVGRVFPLIKADAKLEFAAINSLKQWRFEPLPQNQKQIEQRAVIVFPYRLR